MVNAITSSEILERVGKVVAPLPSQAEYMKELAGILAMHINRNLLIDQGHKPDELPMVSAIVVAPTGQGKTFLLKKMAECLDLNVIVVDCATLVGESYKGVSLSQRLAGAMEEARDERSFSRSLIFFDEVDKLCRSGFGHASGMTSILQLFNGGSVVLNKDDRGSKSVDISRFAILMGGAFAGLEDIVRERVCPKVKIGFSSGEQRNTDNQDWYRSVTVKDLARYGLMMELLGRVGTILTLQPLGMEDYRQLLNAESGSQRIKYENYFQGLYGVHLQITPEGVEALAKVCMNSSDTGARAAEPLMSQYMREAIARVESDEYICKVILDAEGERVCVRYENGQRGAEEKKGEQAENARIHVVRAKNPKNLIDKLCRYYRNACGTTGAEEQWKIFLECAVIYMYRDCRPEDFTLESLEKLAESTHRKSGQSTFERLARRSYYVTRGDLSRLDDVYSEWMSRNLVSGCRSIAKYLYDKHGASRIRFQITEKKKRG